jgi:hypothetical protein
MLSNLIVFISTRSSFFCQKIAKPRLPLLLLGLRMS